VETGWSRHIAPIAFRTRCALLMVLRMKDPRVY